MKITYKRPLVLQAVLSLALWGCYEDKGNYDYTDTNAIKVEVKMPDGGFYVKFGDELHVPATFESELPESEFRFDWQVWSDLAYHNITEGRDLNYAFTSNDYFDYPRAYTLRLAATHVPTGMAAYSENITVNLTAGYQGLMVAHGDGTRSDVGLIVAPEFQMTAMEVETDVRPDMYSWVNGQMIDGTITQIIQSYPKNTLYENQDIVVLTDDGGGQVLKNTDLGFKGDYQSLFFTGPAGVTNKGISQRYYVYERYKIVMDGGDFFMQNLSAPPFMVYTEAFDDLDIDPYSLGFYGGYGLVVFDKTKRGFYYSSMGLLGYSSLGKMEYIPGEGEVDLFNPADMQADLLHFETGGSASDNFIGICRNESGIFAAQINASSGMPVMKVDCNEFTDIDNACFYTFGQTMNTCYYATGNAVYQFAARPDRKTSTQLQTTDAKPVPITGEVTMLKVLKPYIGTPNSSAAVVTYQNYGKILLVGTYENGNGRLYAMLLNGLTGRVTSYTTYDGFGRIVDATIKGS